MKEIEVKILDVNKNEVVKSLLEHGATKIFEGELKSVYLDSNDELKNGKKMLRIRQKGEKCLVTLKVNN